MKKIKNETEARKFTGIWIPKEIWECKELTILEKIMWAEIDNLDNEKGCSKSNKYFANFFGLSITRISNIINSLKRKGLIYQIKFDGRKRILKSRLKEIGDIK